MTRKELLLQNLATTFKEMLPVFDDENIAELALKRTHEHDKWEINWQ